MPAYSPLWGVYTLRKVTTSGNLRRYFRLARRTRKIRALLDASIGAVAGGAALLTHKRIPNSQTEQGGVRKPVLITDLSRVTVAGDMTILRNMFSEDSKIATPVNKGWPNRQTWA